MRHFTARRSSRPRSGLLSALLLVVSSLVVSACAASYAVNSTPAQPSSGSTASPALSSSSKTAFTSNPVDIANEFTPPPGAQRLEHPAYAPTAAFTSTYQQVSVARVTQTWRVPGTGHDALAFYAHHLPPDAVFNQGATYSEPGHNIQTIEVSFPAAGRAGHGAFVQIGATDDAGSALVSLYVELTIPFPRPAGSIIGTLKGEVTLRRTDANDSQIGAAVTATTTQAAELIRLVNASSADELGMCSPPSAFYPQHILIAFPATNGPIEVDLSSPSICGADATLSAQNFVIGLKDSESIWALARKIAPQFSF